MANEKPMVLRDEMDDEMRHQVDKVKDAFLMCLVKRSGGVVRIPVKEADAARDLLTMTMEGDVFILKTTPIAPELNGVRQ